jgi:hypothetical protein
MIKNFSDVKIKKAIQDICDEHAVVARSEDSNIGYLWLMYASGMKKGQFRPFIFLAELNLLLKTDCIKKDEQHNLIKMLTSSDSDNSYLTAYSIISLRNQRIKNMGLWTLENDKYKDVNYIRDILNTNMFLLNS